MSRSPSASIGPDLRAALVAMVKKRVPSSEVDDIVQSTLADAIESPHAPADSDSLRRWIFGIAKNKVVDYHRRAGRETFELPDVPGKSAPHAEADLLRWAEKHLPPGDENKTTLDWMLREGEGEKLEWIAESEKVPAPRVRQRVSRLRRHLKSHWQKEVALLATFGVLITLLVLVIRRSEPEPIANEDVPRAAEIRKEALQQCNASKWVDCIRMLDQAKQLDPAGDARPDVQRARQDAADAVDRNDTPPPTPTPTSTAAPLPSIEPTAVPVPSAMPAPLPRKSFGKTAAPSSPAPGPTEVPSSVPTPLPTAFMQKSFKAPPSKKGGASEPFDAKPRPSMKTSPIPTDVSSDSSAGSK